MRLSGCAIILWDLITRPHCIFQVIFKHPVVYISHNIHAHLSISIQNTCHKITEYTSTFPHTIYSPVHSHTQLHHWVVRWLVFNTVTQIYRNTSSLVDFHAIATGSNDWCYIDHITHQVQIGLRQYWCTIGQSYWLLICTRFT